MANTTITDPTIVASKENQSESSEDTIYLTQIKTTGEAICTCKGWTFKKPGKPRSCKHTKELAEEYKIKEVYGWYKDDAKDTAVEEDTSEMATPAPANPMPMFPIVTTREFNPSKMKDTEYVVQAKHPGVRLFITIGTDGSVNAESFALVKGVVVEHGKFELPSFLTESVMRLPAGKYDAQIYFEGGSTEDVAKYIKTSPDLLNLTFFDILEVTGNNIQKSPFSERREQLEEVFWLAGFTPDDGVNLSIISPATAEAVAEIHKMAGFGALVKKLTSTYTYGVSGVASNRWTLFNPPKKRAKKEVEETPKYGEQEIAGIKAKVKFEAAEEDVEEMND